MNLFIYIYIYIYIYMYMVNDRRSEWLSGCLTGWLSHSINTLWYKLNSFHWKCIMWNDISVCYMNIYIYIYIYIYICGQGQTDWLAGWQTGWMFGWLADWLAVQLICQGGSHTGLLTTRKSCRLTEVKRQTAVVLI